jgi:hypothetical protein
LGNSAATVSYNSWRPPVSARTRIQNLNVEAKMAWQASKANPVAIIKKQRSKLLHAR